MRISDGVQTCALPISTGAWQKGPANGFFTTVWPRDKKGRLSWVLDHGDALATPREAPEFIASKLAVCGSRPAVPIEAAGEGADRAVGLSADQTLSWTSSVRTDQSGSEKGRVGKAGVSP